ncbi:hypothetical protein ABT095_19185 [Kitasatospora sp. NPDC002227]|uniref:tetratricopeptide repeat protein n=1 Tax=Kitasatospora sp. NPDC002227 TaxID=3154773 RepID=UPI003316DEBE
MTTTTPGTRDEFFAALRANRERPKGRAAAAAAEELVDLAESFGDPEVTVSTLVGLMNAYHGSGEAVKYPVAFARLLQLWDEDRKYFDEYETHRLFWFFKWVTSGLLTTPDVPLAAVRGWIAEMRRRYQEAGHGLQPVYAQEYLLARELGENEQLAYELWATRGRTRLSDCSACEPRQRAAHHFRHGEDERGLAELSFEEGGCDEEPHSSQALALLPLLRLGRYDEARAAHLTGYRKVRGKEAELTAIGSHLEFCALTGNEARGLELLAHNRASFGFTAAPGERLAFLTGVQVLLARLAEVGHGSLPCAGPLGAEWSVDQLLAEVTAQGTELAARFDARNGNDAVSARRRARLAQRPLVEQLNLGVQTAAPARPAETAVAAPVATVPAPELPEDFAELVAEAHRLDRTGHPGATAVWDAVISRAEQADADGVNGVDGVNAVDERLRGEITSELAQRAVERRDWDACVELLKEAVEHFTEAGLEARAIAAEARLAWCGAARVEDAEGAEAAAEAAWPVLEELLERVDAVLAAGAGAGAGTGARSGSGSGSASGEEWELELRRRLVVRQSRVFTARHVVFHSEGAVRARWVERFEAEAQALIAAGEADGGWAHTALGHELLGEVQGAEGEAHARRAVEIFEEQGWPWRLPRGRMVLALVLGAQGRAEEAMAELERGLAEATAEVPADDLTGLHRMLGNIAMRSGRYQTAVRALSEAAARLDREGKARKARETRLELAHALSEQGSTGDAVAVLESLLDPAGADSAGGRAKDGDGDSRDGEAREGKDGDGKDGAPSQHEELTARIRLELANGLLELDEPRDAAVQFLQLADSVSRWPVQEPLTTAAAGAARALALAGNWEGAKAALERAIESNRVAPLVPELTGTLRTLAAEAMSSRGAEAAEEALGYLDQADLIREEFADAAREQFRSVEVDLAQCLYERGRVHGTAERPEEALACFEEAVAAYERGGAAKYPGRFEATRMAALVEARLLDRVEAARTRLDRSAAEADAAGLADAAVTLRRLRESLR